MDENERKASSPAESSRPSDKSLVQDNGSSTTPPPIAANSIAKYSPVPSPAQTSSSTAETNASIHQHGADVDFEMTIEEKQKQKKNCAPSNKAADPAPAENDSFKNDEKSHQVTKKSTGEYSCGNEEKDSTAMTDDHVENDDGRGDRNEGTKLSLSALNSLDSTRSLGLLALKFMNLLKSSITESIDLNDASNILREPNDRICDIVNVLEGIGLVEKQNSNDIHWKRRNVDRENENPVDNKLREDENNLAEGENNDNHDSTDKMETQKIEAVKKEIEDLYKEDSKLDVYLAMMRKLSNCYLSKKCLYCTQEDFIDILFSNNNRNCEQGGKTNSSSNDDGNMIIEKGGGERDSSCLIVIRAPAGSTMEVPHPSEGFLDGRKQYELRICNETAKLPTLEIGIPELKLHKHDKVVSNGDICSSSSSNNMIPSASSEKSNNDSEPLTKKPRVASISDDQQINDSNEDEHQQQQEQKVEGEHLQQERKPNITSNDLGQTSSTPEPCDECYEMESLPASLQEGALALGKKKKTKGDGTGTNSNPASVVVDPIDVYYMHCKYDPESKKYVSKSKTKRINPVALMIDEVARGSFLDSYKYDINDKSCSNSNGNDENDNGPSLKEEEENEPAHEHVPDGSWLGVERGISDFFHDR